MREGRVQCIGPHGLHHMAYVEWGDPANPRVLVCVHGLTRNGRDFDVLAQALASEYRVVCPDVVGRGRSDWLSDKSDYGFPLYLSDMVTLIARLGVERVDWLGTSMGGLIGMLLAALPGTPIRRLILNDVGPKITAASLRRIGEYVGRSPRFASEDEAIAYMKQICAPFGPHTEQEWRQLILPGLRQGPDGWRVAYDPAIGDAFRAAPLLLDVDLWASYDAIRCPTLVIRGAESDLLEPATFAEMGVRGPRARLYEVPGVGHAPTLIKPAQIEAVANFLRDTAV